LDNDRDPTETREWLDALDSVEAFDGVDRVDELLNGIVGAARRKGAKLSFAANTAYINTIPPHAELAHPGDRTIEDKIRALIRWNDATIVLRANKTSSELGGHVASVVGQPMLARKAVHEAKVAAEVAAGQNSVFDAKVIPSVAYTDPEVAWVGMTEIEAKASGIKYGKGGRSLGRDEGVTKILFDEVHERIIGCGIVGPSAGDLIAEAALAIEMGADAADIGLTIHPHPTLSETIGMAAEAFEGTITDLYIPKKKTAWSGKAGR